MVLSLLTVPLGSALLKERPDGAAECDTRARREGQTRTICMPEWILSASSVQMSDRGRAGLGELLILVCAGVGLALSAKAQDLTPRAYLITPTSSNAVVVA